MKNFIAVDVETANENASSICAIGAVKVRDGVVVDKKYSLVCPEPNYYKYFCTKVHGLTDNDTWNAPNFGTLWSEWAEWLEDLPLVAHNAPFDSKCIRSACRIYGLDEPKCFSTPLPKHAALSLGACVRLNRSTAFANFSVFHSNNTTTPFTTPLLRQN